MKLRPRPVVLVDRNDAERTTEAMWDDYRTPQTVTIENVLYTRCGVQHGLPVYREVADGYRKPITRLDVRIIDRRGATVSDCTVDVTALGALPQQLTVGRRQATLTTIAGPDGRVLYTIEAPYA